MALHDLSRVGKAPHLTGLRVRGLNLLQISPTVFQVFFIIDLTGRCKYLDHGSHCIRRRLAGVELVAV